MVLLLNHACLISIEESTRQLTGFTMAAIVMADLSNVKKEIEILLPCTDQYDRRAIMHNLDQRRMQPMTEFGVNLLGTF